MLFSSWPSHGHLLPMLPLIRAATAAGHEVRVASGPDLVDLVAGRGLTAEVAGPTLAQAYAAAAESVRRTGSATLSEVERSDPQQAALLAARAFFGAAAIRRARDLLAGFDRWRPDLVVHDTVEVGGATAALVAGIPHVLHSYGPMVPAQGDFARAIGAVVAGAGLPDPIEAVFAAPYLQVCPPSLAPDGAEPWTDVVPIRPSAGEAAAGEARPAGLADLPHPTTVYLTLGTVTNRAPEVFRTVLDGCARFPVNVLVTTGPGTDAAAVAGGRPAVLALPFVSQALVLPDCVAVISHCGAGTMFGALGHGLPQLCLPQGTDQPANAAAVARAGAGLVLPPDRVDGRSVQDALDRVLHDPALRSAAERVRAEIDRMPAAQDVVPVIVDRAGR
ncbi:glycosyltransferase [Nakamurella sp.]|uniref:glycosyltransferase n=1 Tax=Nakamurella sp. TaxID=1869182 RepID=UPI003B3B0EBE